MARIPRADSSLRPPRIHGALCVDLLFFGNRYAAYRI